MREYLELLYLDRSFISALFEVETGEQPETKITSSDTLHASARIPLFTGGASSVESKTYSVSSIGMLAKLNGRLKSFPTFETKHASLPDPHGYYWIKGTLTVQLITRSRSVRDPVSGKTEKKKISEQPYLAIDGTTAKFALIATDDYFMSGLVALRELHDTVVGSVDIQVEALVRVLSAQTSFKQWIAVPLVVYEK